MRRQGKTFATCNFLLDFSSLQVQSRCSEKLQDSSSPLKCRRLRERYFALCNQTS
ncbi:Uncharacterized protein APZ42_027726 [Daphnia magna]|uniref:Uncharacterized protein n=1 Tax=Daphnia magna TaxID=35525 RepID=A0A164R4Q0_9CRUS|nr:Uncharacterized protein APZ42_027726 [Daphnia magna]